MIVFFITGNSCACLCQFYHQYNINDSPLPQLPLNDPKFPQENLGFLSKDGYQSKEINMEYLYFQCFSIAQIS